MKRLSLLLGLIFILPTIFFVISCQKKGTEIVEGKRDQKIIATFVLGKVAKKLQSGEWDIIKVGDVIKSSDVVRLSEKSRLVLQTETGSIITLTDESQITISSILDTSTNDENTDIKLEEGKAIVNPRDIKSLKNSSFSVRTPAMVAGVRGTVFTIEHKKGESKVMVKEGKVNVKPSLKIETDKQEKLPEIEVSEGKKSIITKDVIKEMEKKIESGKMEASDIVSVAKVESVTEEEKKVLENDAKTLVKVNVNVDPSTNSIVKKEEVYSITVVALGADIYINGEMKGSEYYSSFYPKGKLLIEIKSGLNVIMSKEVDLNSDITLDYTPVEKMKEEINKTLEKKELTPLYNIKFGDANIYISSDYVIGVTGSKVIFTDNKKVIKEIVYNKKVMPLVSDKAVFLYDGDNVVVYSSNGDVINKVKLGSIIFSTNFVFDNNIAYISNATGNVIGIDIKGNKVFEEKVRGSISGIGVNNGYIVVATVSNIYVIEKGKIVSQFAVDSSAKIINKVAVMGKTKKLVVVPQDNNILTIRDFSGNIVNRINVISGDIEPMTDEVFAVLYSNRVVLYNIEGSKIKEIGLTREKFIVSNGYVYSWDKNKIIRYGLEGEKIKDMPEDITSVSLYNNKMVVYTVNNNIYHIDF